MYTNASEPSDQNPSSKILVEGREGGGGGGESRKKGLKDNRELKHRLF